MQDEFSRSAQKAMELKLICATKRSETAEWARERARAGHIVAT